MRPDTFQKRCVLLWVDAACAVPQNCDSPAACIEGGAMCDGVHASRESGGNRHACGREQMSEFPSQVL